MALSTTRTLLTQTGINTTQVLDVGGLSSSGIATFSNFKTGTTDVHSVGVNAATMVVGSAVTSNSDGIEVTGIVTATSFVGSGANLTGIDATAIQTGTTKVQTVASRVDTTINNVGILTVTSSGVNVTGVITATSFSGIDTDKISEGNTEAEVVDTGSNGHFKVTTEGTERFRIDNSGNVGVGTNVASDSSGSAQAFTIARTGTNGQLRLILKNEATGFGNGAGFHQGIDGTNVFIENRSNGGHIDFSTNSLSRFRITSDGDLNTIDGTTSLNKHSVGIGTTTTAGRNAGVGTAGGTIVYNTTSGQLEIYTSNEWVAVYEPPFEATGGTKNTSSRSGYAVHTFTGPGTFEVTGSPKSGGEYLIVGGGGGGGKGALGPSIGFEVGGGGAGGHRSFSGATFTPGTYPVVVGSGGPGGGANQGGNSSVFGETAAGGGGGAGHDQGNNNGRPGGSGGGGAHQNTPGGSGNTPPTSPPQGNNGGTGGVSCGGGGGGAGGGGNNGANSSGHGGPAGNGTSNSITGSSVTRAGGGGGGGYGNRASGGSGGGGAGGKTGSPSPQGGASSSGDNGTANTGGGGGGSGFVGVPGGNGGSGVVIIAYPTS